jgi:hypothetical protein
MRLPSADDARYAVKAFSLTIGTFHGIGLRKVHPFGYPAFRTVGKRGGFHKFPADPEFPAVDAETAVFGRLGFMRKTLYPAPGHGQDPVLVIGHAHQIPFDPVCARRA